MSVAAMLALSLMLNADTNNTPAADKTFSVDISKTTRQLKAGANGVFRMQIHPAKGYKVSREAPLKIKLASTGVTLKKDRLGQKDADGKDSKAPRFAVDFTAATAGKASIDGKAVFFICNADLCERKSHPVKVAVHIDP